MKYALAITMLVLCFACNNTAENKGHVATDTTANKVQSDSPAKFIHTFADTALENKIAETLMKLPFIKKSDAYIDSFSNHQHGIAFMMDEPRQTETAVSVKAGYNGGERFETYYHFVVDPKTMEIKLYDPIDDKTITLKEYLKTQR